MENRRDEISERLRLKPEEAKVVYDRACQQYNRLMAIAADTDTLEEPAFQDGIYAMRKAMQVHRQARLQYQHALKDFTDFILHGKMPTDLDS